MGIVVTIILIFCWIWYCSKLDRNRELRAQLDRENARKQIAVINEQVKQKINPIVTPIAQPTVISVPDMIDDYIPQLEAMGKYRPQILSVPEWFIALWGDADNPSPAELLIINELRKYNVKWHREVSFVGLQLASKGWARFDFLLELPYGIHIIEYDGAQWHSTPERIEIDNIKTSFCRQHKIPITRYNKYQYYKMEQAIKDLMDLLDVKRL